MTLPLIALIAAIAGLAAAGAAWLLVNRSAGARDARRLAISGIAFLAAAIAVGGALSLLARAPAEDGPERKVLEAIQRHHPEAVKDIASIRAETDPAVAQRRASELAQRYLPRHVPTTSDAAVLRFTGEIAKLFETLAQRDPETCRVLSTGGQVSARFQASQMKPALDAMAQVIDDSVDAAQPPPPPERAQQLMAGVIQRVYAKHADLAPPQMLTQPAALPALQLCRTMVAIYREILDLPPADASAVLRTLMRGGQQPQR
ncbi:MAG: hypothetical protein AB7R90_18755 [Reyranellaceae bacterium]